MKKLILSILFVGGVLTSCKETFLEVPPQDSSVTEDVLGTKAGVQKLLVGAYHDLTGMSLSSRWWPNAASNWIWADITAGDAFRSGYDATEEPESIAIELFQVQPTFDYLNLKFKAMYDGVARSNSVLRSVAVATDMTDDEKVQAIGEARLLRGHFHFDLKKIWNMVPYIDEHVIDFKLSNDKDIWINIEADFKYGYANLSETKQYKGQANKWAAASFLAKAFIFQQKWDSAKVVLDDIIANGVTAQGEKYGLNDCFSDNFTGVAENGKEAILQVQYSGNDLSYGNDSNQGDLNQSPVGIGPTVYYTVWKQPSFNLVNAYKTDATGLPMPGTFNDVNMDNDMGIASADQFIPYQGTLDPRLDWTVGRRGVPYLDWPYGGADPNPGMDWLVNQAFGGPYTPMKGIYRYADQYDLTYVDYGHPYAINTTVNYSLIRYADVLLWAAETEIELGNLDKGRDYINQVRSRAKNGCYVPVINDALADDENSANYLIDLYTTSFASKDDAITALRFERRLELALEGHRFFDLVRWGIAADYINTYLAKESTRIAHLQGITFTAGKNEYFPLPQTEIDLSNSGGKPLLKQNPNY